MLKQFDDELIDHVANKVLEKIRNKDNNSIIIQKKISDKIEEFDINLASYIDHTLLKPNILDSDLEKLCQEALNYNFYSVCVASANVKKVKQILKDSNIKITSTIAFPLGNQDTQIKVKEALKAVEDGADEIDMVININELKNKNYDFVYNDIKAVKDTIKDKILKVIIETSELTYEEKIIAATIVKLAKADFVKTSTGFSKNGATIEDVKLLRNIVGDNFGVKASGGIKTYEDAYNMIKAGANRLGTSSSVAIVTKQNLKNSSGY